MKLQSVFPNDIENVNNDQIDERYKKLTLEFKNYTTKPLVFGRKYSCFVRQLKKLCRLIGENKD